jgi:uncharacterized protein YidB (DUF937 family)
MDLQGIATKMLMEKLESNIDAGAAGQALSKLIGEGGEMDLGGMVSQLSGGSLAGAAKSWLGDGDSDAVSAEQLTDALGSDKVAGFASQLGIGQADAAGGLAAMLPQLINESS